MENLAARGVLRLAPTSPGRLSPLEAPTDAEVALAVPGGWLLRQGDDWGGWRHGTMHAMGVRGRQRRVDLDLRGRALLVSTDNDLVAVRIDDGPTAKLLGRVDGAAVHAAAWLAEGVAILSDTRLIVTRWVEGGLVGLGAFTLVGAREATAMLDGRVVVASGQGTTSFVGIYPDLQARLLGRFAGEASRWSSAGGAQWASRNDRLWLDGRMVRCAELPRAYAERRGEPLPEEVEIPLVSPPPTTRRVSESGVQPIPWL